MKRIIKVALLASFTLRAVKQVLSTKCLELGISLEFYEADYNQYNQEILDSKSGLYKFAPDLVIVAIDTMSLLGEYFFYPYTISDSKRKKLVREKIGDISKLIDILSNNIDGKVVFHNFEVPSYSPLGILENKQDFGFFESIRTINEKLAKKFRQNSKVFVFDLESFCSKIGKNRIIDPKMYYLADMKVDLRHISALCDEYMGYIKPFMSMTKKCIVLDLDNTLWGGVVGEDGIEGIKLGPTPEGRSFWEFQKLLLALFHRGVILAVNSKNNFEDALGAIRNHPYMILREEHFASMQINWNDKISNMKVIAKEINIGLESLVFIDDDKLNREMIRSAFPEVLVVDLPEDFSLYTQTLMEITDFNTFQLTEEDMKKGKMYVQQRKRSELEGQATDISEYLRALEMIVTIEKTDAFNIPRMSQLTQKTNQFNMTTRRYAEEDIQKFVNDGCLVISVKVEDKFGDNGITGVVIVKKEQEWMIDTFLLSCRIIGRQVENVLLAYVAEEAKKAGAEFLLGEFIPTKKNIPAKDFYKNNGFNLKIKSKKDQLWEYDLSDKYTYPDFIEIIKGG